MISTHTINTKDGYQYKHLNSAIGCNDFYLDMSKFISSSFMSMRKSVTLDTILEILDLCSPESLPILRITVPLANHCKAVHTYE